MSTYITNWLIRDIAKNFEKQNPWEGNSFLTFLSVATLMKLLLGTYVLSRHTQEVKIAYS